MLKLEAGKMEREVEPENWWLKPIKRIVAFSGMVVGLLVR
jgi:hypothetical protein